MSTLSPSEWKTRRSRIDPKLNARGWNVAAKDATSAAVPPGTAALTEYPTDNGPADYVLCNGGRILGVVEAKKLAVSPSGVLTQAQRYAEGIPSSPFDFRGLGVPFLYSTNGEVIHFHDIRDPLNLSRTVKHFHTPAALEEMLGRNFGQACEWFTANPNNHHWLRSYQKEANAAVEKAITERKRNMLLAMATGTGKTVTLVNQVYRLLKSKAAKRVLFLVDRRALAAQAVKTFAAFEPEPNQKFNALYPVFSQRFKREDFGDEDEKFDPTVLPADYLLDPQAKHTFVYVCTIQRMAVNLFGRVAAWGGEGDEIDDDAEQLDIPIHAFDVIVADECHRGYTTAEQSIWRNTLDHFDAIKIGLTATPAAHTKAYFKDVVFRYEYSRAVREGHLVDYDVVKLRSNVRVEGVFLKEGEGVEFVDTETGNKTHDQLEDQRAFENTEVEKAVTSPDSNRKILAEIKKYADAHEKKYKRFPKTLIFAANDTGHTSHANELVELAKSEFGRGESFVQKITGIVDRPLQRIREFRNRPNPGIVVSVDLMSTGVDIPDLEYIVFLRPVKSRILFEQMIGRGTRKGEKHPDKSHFVVFDCFDGTLLEFSKNCTGVTAEPPEKPKATDAHISIVGHITDEELHRYLTATESANGFGNRFMWFLVRRSKLLPDGGTPDLAALAAVESELAEVLNFARSAGELCRDTEAGRLWRDVYPILSGERRGLAGSLTGRAEAHVLRLSLIYAVLDCAQTVRVEHLLAALAVWQYADESVLCLFGDSTGNPMADEILALLRNAPNGMSRNDIRGMVGKNVAAERISRALGVLLGLNLARFDRRETGGRPAELWFATARRGGQPCAA